MNILNCDGTSNSKIYHIRSLCPVHQAAQCLCSWWGVLTETFAFLFSVGCLTHTLLVSPIYTTNCVLRAGHILAGQLCSVSLTGAFGLAHICYHSLTHLEQGHTTTHDIWSTKNDRFCVHVWKCVKLYRLSIGFTASQSTYVEQWRKARLLHGSVNERMIELTLNSSFIVGLMHTQTWHTY